MARNLLQFPQRNSEAGAVVEHPPARVKEYASMTDPQCILPPDLPQEAWRPVLGYEGFYEVSNHGRVRRVGAARGTTVGRLLRPHLSLDDGYYRVNLHRGNGTPIGRLRVHQLVAVAFIGPVPDGHEVNHIDLDRSNNVVTNLEYLTHLGNVHHAIQNGRGTNGERNGMTTLRECDVRAIRVMRRLGAPLVEVANIYGISVQSVCDISKRRSWKHVA